MERLIRHESPVEIPAQIRAEQQPENAPYELLVGHFRSDKSFKTDEELRTEYVQLTDGLICQMVEGVKVKNEKTGRTETRRPDVVIWLDKSARPVSWLTKDLWPTLAAEADGTIPKMPEFRFVNIDREQWVNTVDPTGSGKMDIDRVDNSVVRSLRSIFIEPKYKEDGISEDIDAVPSDLDGKTVLIIDEVLSTGRTLDIASRFFKKAFPTAGVATTHWMSGIYRTPDGAQGNADLPIWYREDSVLGRGVGNRDERLSAKSESRTQRLGAWFLSTRLKLADPASLQLRKEFKQLAQDVRTHKVLFLPSTHRELDDWDERAERINQQPVGNVLEAKGAMLHRAATYRSPIRSSKSLR